MKCNATKVILIASLLFLVSRTFWWVYDRFELKSNFAFFHIFIFRLGLIRARLAGARLAKGDVLVFLDAHCEAVVGWIEPLLARIKESHNSVLVPIIDVIDSKDFHYSINGYKNFQVNFYYLIWCASIWICLGNNLPIYMQKEGHTSYFHLLALISVLMVFIYLWETRIHLALN